MPTLEDILSHMKDLTGKEPNENDIAIAKKIVEKCKTDKEYAELFSFLI